MSGRGCVGLVVVGLLLSCFSFVLGGSAFQYVNSQPWFCNSCHEMNFYYQSWQNSTHGAHAKCLECHSEPGIAGFVEEKARGAEQLVAHFRGDYPQPIRILVRVKNDQCLACHPDAADIADAARSANHAVHIDNNVLCADCHNRITHADVARHEPKIVPLAKCESCHHAHDDFPLLVGKHATADCQQCHPNGKYQATSPQCETCHQPPVSNHPGEGANCQVCHTPQGWKPVAVDHSKTNFQLVGMHQQASCAGCHGKPLARVASTLCEACHQPPAQNHPGASSGCQFCHSPQGWTQTTTFDHAQTGFALEGKHQTVACGSCHGSPFTKPASNKCEACHKPPAANHPGGNTNCEFCHTTAGWDKAQFDHNQTALPLTGQHKQIACAQCHGDPFTKPASALCEACHQPPAQNHPGGKTQCETCHSTSGWKPANIDHSQTRFPLIGQHLQVTCRQCHGDPFTKPASLLCEGCHKPPTENHPGGSTNCQQCHNPNGWDQVNIDHNQFFALSGQHQNVACKQCHGDPFAKAPGTLCENCHQPPANHPGGNTNCQQCHSPNGWDQVNIDHDQFFPLSGQHQNVACKQCHGDPFAKAPGTLCENCHQPPANHPGGNTNCQQCHNPNGWDQVNIDHDQFFPLSGQHQNVACKQCHGDPFAKAPGTACSACHQPPGSHAGMPTTCENCHTPKGFKPANFRHPQVGEHIPSGENPLSCDKCHRTGVFAQHQCTGSGCHSNNNPGGEGGS